MADSSLAHRAQNATRTETVNLPRSAPPTNHGKTTAAWVTVWMILVGALVASVAVVLANVPLVVVGFGVIVVGLVVGGLLRLAGHGQGGEATKARQARSGGH